jgi:3'(2'), 5'-bisphosphate nucleotidase
MWTLDPIDGTKGFLRGGQYAVVLALVVDSKVQFGIMGCPNLPVSPTDPEGERGCIFVATRGQGAEQVRLLFRFFLVSPFSKRPINNLGPAKAIRHPQTLPPMSSIALLESVEAMHSSHSFSTIFSKYLNITAPPLRMDSQAKYSCLARGEGGIYFRSPVKGTGYREKIWVGSASP